MLIKFSIVILSILLAAYIVPGVSVSGLYIAIIIAILLGIANLTIRPILTILTLPIHIFTLGLSAFFINVGIFWFLSTFVQGFTVNGLLPAILGALIISIGSSIASTIS